MRANETIERMRTPSPADSRGGKQNPSAVAYLGYEAAEGSKASAFIESTAYRAMRPPPILQADRARPSQSARTSPDKPPNHWRPPQAGLLTQGHRFGVFPSFFKDSDLMPKPQRPLTAARPCRIYTGFPREKVRGQLATCGMRRRIVDGQSNASGVGSQRFSLIVPSRPATLWPAWNNR